jgi:hypothetical protein
MGRRNPKPLLIGQEGVFFTREEVVPVDMDGGMDDADMCTPMGKSLKIMLKHHGKPKPRKGENNE